MEMTSLIPFQSKRLTVLTGHFGSGKTEIAINFTLGLARQGFPTVLADLDVVDPYFRSRERMDLLHENGVRLITSSPGEMDADLPYMPAEIMALFENEELYGVLDVGGDGSGARVLARYRRYLKEAGADIICVINANRPLTETAEDAIR